MQVSLEPCNKHGHSRDCGSTCRTRLRKSERPDTQGRPTNHNLCNTNIIEVHLGETERLHTTVVAQKKNVTRLNRRSSNTIAERETKQRCNFTTLPPKKGEKTKSKKSKKNQKNEKKKKASDQDWGGIIPWVCAGPRLQVCTFLISRESSGACMRCGDHTHILNRDQNNNNNTIWRGSV